MMDEATQAGLLLERCRPRLSGPEIEGLELIVEEGGVPWVWDHLRQTEVIDRDAEGQFTRLCTEFAEFLR